MVYNCIAYKYLNECIAPCHFALHEAAYTPRQRRKYVNFITTHSLTSRFSEMNCILVLGFTLNETDINNVFKEVHQINFCRKWAEILLGEMLIGGGNLIKSARSNHLERAAKSFALTGSTVSGRKSKNSSSNLSREILGAVFFFKVSLVLLPCSRRCVIPVVCEWALVGL